MCLGTSAEKMCSNSAAGQRVGASRSRSAARASWDSTFQRASSSTRDGICDDAGVDFPLLHASAEAVPLTDASFDIVFCDHGAMTYCDPCRTVPEAGRMLRQGGLLAFSAATPILNVCWNESEDRVDDHLHANYFDQRRFEDASSVGSRYPTASGSRYFAAMDLPSRI